MPVEEVEELDKHIEKLKKSGKETSKTQFIRELILKEIRKNDESI